MKWSMTSVATFAPQLGFALVHNGWYFTGRPSGGLRDITFPFNMSGAPHDSGYYFAQMFNFHNVPDVGYCGIQNRPNHDGQSVVHAVFSSFQAGTNTHDQNCHYGADGGPGVSCKVDIIGDYNHMYILVVKNIHGTTWTGTVVNTNTGYQARVGTYTLPSAAGGIQSSQFGFVEYYPWNDGNSQCAQLPKTEVTMYNPSTETPNAGTGITKMPYEYGDCKGKVKFSTKQVFGGFNIVVGF